MKDLGTDAEELRYWLALVRMPGIGAVNARRLLAHWDSPRRLFEAKAEIAGLDAAAEAYRRRPDWRAVDKDLAWLDAADRHLLTLHDPRYSPLLKEIADPPPLLFVRGDPDLLAERQVAIVGSRNPTAGGERNAADFARCLAECGLVITSGLAVGVDAAAHRGALAAGGATLAVTGSGLGRIYPARHRSLADEIAARGALVSEFAPETAPRPENFPRRNRLISGLALGTLVVEAALRSGSLITARLAAEQGREVFAIPGSIHNPLSRGCHALLRQGAKLVECAGDVLEELGPLVAWGAQATAARIVAPGDDGDTEFHELLNHIGFEPTAVDTVVERSGLTAERVSSMLVLLELQGHVTSAPGGLYTRIPT